MNNNFVVRFAVGLLVLCVGAGLLFVLAGCREKKNDDWFDESSGRKLNRQDYIEFQRQFGISEADAARQYDENEAATRTRRPSAQPQ
ncbi:MAG TPA: hypothetical protein PJ991_07685 [Kiritimatiellia bacterium]|nr:hypothetical protein [Kiritimatiellia bacterium]